MQRTKIMEEVLKDKEHEDLRYHELQTGEWDLVCCHSKVFRDRMEEPDLPEIAFSFIDEQS